MINKNYKLNPNWITGFIDAEGSFYSGVLKSNKRNIGWRVNPGFQIKLHIRDKELLLKIKSFFENRGTIVIYKNCINYYVRSIKDITEVIIPHFEKYPLITQKQNDFLIWKEISMLISKNEHLNMDGLVKILNLKVCLNNGISYKLKISFPNIIKKEKLKIEMPLVINYDWIAGFFSGEGCFHISVSKSKTHRIGHAVHLLLYINQHSRDKDLINKLINVLNCGYTFEHSSGNARVFSVTKFKDIYEKIIPFFNKHKIIGVKALDYQDFCKAAELINTGAHLSLEGLKEIQIIKSRMNKNRYTN